MATRYDDITAGGRAIPVQRHRNQPTRLELLHEANRRGILPPDKKRIYDEAVRRGLISPAPDKGSILIQPSGSRLRARQDEPVAREPDLSRLENVGRADHPTGFSPQKQAIADELRRRGVRLPDQPDQLAEGIRRFAREHPEIRVQITDEPAPTRGMFAPENLLAPTDPEALRHLKTLRREPEDLRDAEPGLKDVQSILQRNIERYGTPAPAVEQITETRQREVAEELVRDIPRPLRPFALGVFQSGVTTASTLTRPLELFGIDAADVLQQASQSIGEAQQSIGDSYLEQMLTGAVRSVTDAITLGTMIPGGGPGVGALGRINEFRGVIAGFTLKGISDAITEGRAAGLSGAKLASYASLHGGMEGLMMSAFAALGMGGIENIAFAKSIVRGITPALRQLGVSLLHELPEEVLTTISQQLISLLHGVDPAALENLGPAIRDTVVQTILTVGLSETIRPRQREAKSTQLDSTTESALRYQVESGVMTEGEAARTRNRLLAHPPAEAEAEGLTPEQVSQKLRRQQAEGLAEVSREADADLILASQQRLEQAKASLAQEALTGEAKVEAEQQVDRMTADIQKHLDQFGQQYGKEAVEALRQQFAGVAEQVTNVPRAVTRAERIRAEAQQRIERAPEEMPEPPRDLTKRQLLKWADEHGFDTTGLQDKGKRIILTQLGMQRAQRAIRRVGEISRAETAQRMAEQRQLPSESAGWDAGQLRRFAQQHGYEINNRRVQIDVERGTKPRDAIRQQIEAQYVMPPGEGLVGERVRPERRVETGSATLTPEQVRLKMQRQAAEGLALMIEKDQAQKAPAKVVQTAVQKTTPIEGTDHKKRRPSTIERFITPISRLILDISPRTFGRLMKYEHAVGTAPERILKQHVEGMRTMQADLGGPKSEKYTEFTRHLLNQDHDAAKKLLSPESAKTLDEMRGTLDMLRDNFLAAGGEIGNIENYWPRYVTDYKAWRDEFGPDTGVYEDAWREAEKLKGSPLTVEERIDVVNSVNQGFGPRKPGQTGLPPARKRKIERLNDKQASFYLDPMASFVRYTNEIVRATERMKFLGKGTNQANLHESVGRIVQEEIDAGQLDPDQQANLRNLLNVRFTADFITTSKGVSLVRQMIHIATLGQFRNALKQLRDIVPTVITHGPVATAKGFSRAIGLTARDKRIMMESIGVHALGTEFHDVGKMAQAVNTTFKTTGFARIDRLGKETRLNAAAIRIQEIANQPDRRAFQRFEREYSPMFEPAEWSGIVADLKAGRLSEGASTVLLIDITKVQPINQSQMPVKYLQTNYGRLFYTLRTFAMNEFDFVRREIVRKLRTPGQRREGLEGLGRLLVFAALIGAGEEFIRKLLQGRPLDIDDVPDDMMWSMLDMVNLNRYALGTTWSESPFDAAMDMITPPITPFANVWKDATTVGDGTGLRSLKNVPVVGDLVYYRFGRGADLDEKEAKAKFREDMQKLWQEAYVARSGGDTAKARMLMRIYNERAENGPDRTLRKITFDDVQRPAPGVMRAEHSDLRQQAISAFQAKDYRKVRELLRTLNATRKTSLTFEAIREAASS